MEHECAPAPALFQKAQFSQFQQIGSRGLRRDSVRAFMALYGIAMTGMSHGVTEQHDLPVVELVGK